jgi:hypothetical protein
MPTSTVVRGSIFAAGLLVGIGAGGAIFAKRDRRQSAGGAAPDSRPVTSGAIVDIHTPRNQVVLAGTRVTDVSNQILRYGFPGALIGVPWESLVLLQLTTKPSDGQDRLRIS